MSTNREHDIRLTTARWGLGATAVLTALLLPAAAATADTSTGQPSKAQVEHAERLGATGATKAQIEHAERQTTSGRSSTAPGGTSTPISASSSDAAAWELAASAAVGALLTATAMVGARRFGHRERALAH
jgi:hypothetical protein